MVWFPFQYWDVSRWREEGLPLSTTSDVAAKLLDASITQLIFNDDDPSVSSLEESMNEMVKADPDFIMGKVFNYLLGIMGNNPYKNGDIVRKIYDLNDNSKNATKWEKEHIKAICCLAKEDLSGSIQIWEDILVDHPKDVFALHFNYFGHLLSGRSRGMRDNVYRVVDEFKKHDRFYGNIHGKLCFGFEENNQFELARKHGEIALSHTPNEIWSIHSLAHVLYESNRTIEGLELLESKAANWKPRVRFSQHLWWHKTLCHFELGQFDEILDLYDSRVKPVALKGKEEFPLSDAASLLLRLEMEGNVKGLKDRWRELGEAYLDRVENTGLIFYDFHTMIGLVFGGQKEAAEKFKENLAVLAKGGTEEEPRSGWNVSVCSKIAVPLSEAVTAYSQGDFDKTVDLMNPIRYDVRDFLGGSRAQSEIANLILINAAIRSGRRALAKQLINERLARGGKTCDDEPCLNDRLMKMLAHN